MIRLNPNEACEQWLVFNAFLYDPVKVKLTKVPRHPTPRASFLRNRTGSSCPEWVMLSFHCCTRWCFLLVLIWCCLDHLAKFLFCIWHIDVIACVAITGHLEWVHILFNLVNIHYQNDQLTMVSIWRFHTREMIPVMKCQFTCFLFWTDILPWARTKASARSWWRRPRIVRSP